MKVEDYAMKNSSFLRYVCSVAGYSYLYSYVVLVTVIQRCSVGYSYRP